MDVVVDAPFPLAHSVPDGPDDARPVGAFEDEPPRLQKEPAGWSGLSRVFIRISGAEPEILFAGDWRSPYDNRFDIPYFVGLGGAILATAVLGGLSATFASAMVFSNGGHFFRYLPIGVVVGAVLFNIDRWLVADSDVGYDRGRHVFFGWLGNLVSELLKLAPRLAVSLVLGFLFAEPLLLQFFDVDVEHYLHHAYVQQVDDLTNQKVRHINRQFKTAQKGLGALQKKRGRLAPATEADLAQQLKILEAQERAGDDITVVRGLIRADRVIIGRARQQFLDLHQAEYDSYRQTLANVTTLRTLNAVEIAQLGHWECPYPGRNADPTDVYPATVQPGLSLGLACPEAPTGAIDRLDAIAALGTPADVARTTNGATSGVQGSAASTQATEGRSAEHVRRAIWLLRGGLIGLDILPVLVKFIRGILPKKGYYLAVAARQRQVDFAHEGIGDYASQRYQAEERTRRTLQAAQEELAGVQREKLIQSAIDWRTRLGLRWLERRGSELLRRDRARAEDDSAAPPPRDLGDQVPPSSSTVSGVDTGVTAGESDDAAEADEMDD